MDQATRSAGPGRILRFGVYDADLSIGELRKNGRKISLQEKPFQVLALLLARPGELVTREDLQRQLWPDTVVDFELGINTAIKKIREALGDSAESPRFVETLPKRGYRFICPVETLVSSDTAPRSADHSREDRTGSVPSSGVAGEPRTDAWRHRVRAWQALTALAVVLVTGLSVSRLRSGSARNVTGEHIESIAVLPFTSPSRDLDQDSLADGFTEELITQLAQLNGLRVTSHTSVLQYKGQTKPVPQIGGELRVDAIVEGTVTRSGSKIRVTAQLIQTATDLHVWAGRYEGDSQDVLAVENDLAKAVASEIRTKVTSGVLAKLQDHGTQVPAAYESYVKGRGFLRADDMPRKNDYAIQAFQEAIQADPSYALAYAGLGEAYWNQYEAMHQDHWRIQAQDACSRALALDSKRSDPHICLATLHRGMGDYELAAREFSEGIELDPQSADAYRGRAKAYESLGKIRDAEKDYLLAVELDPRNWMGYSQLGTSYFRQGRYGEAVKNYEKSLEVKPDNSEPRFDLGAAYLEMGQYDKAVSVLQTAVQLSPGFGAYENLGSVLLYGRCYEPAITNFQTAIAKSPNDYRGYGNLARAYFWAGQPELARGEYAHAVELAKQKLITNPKDEDVNLSLAIYYAMLEQNDLSVSHLDRALDSQSIEPETAFWAGIVHLRLGNKSKALVWLKQARMLRYSAFELSQAPELLSLGKDPAFKTLISTAVTQAAANCGGQFDRRTQ